MRLSHVVSQIARRALRRYPWLRYVSLTTSVLTLLWAYTLYRGERSTFASHIQACHWDKWEEWPHDASPHHLVFIADPQLVDPHTYPGRPWPLSSLTEIYTDMYMSRNFRLINERLDPDSVVLLGDLFDGGREWGTERALPLTQDERQYLIDKGVIKEDTWDHPEDEQKAGSEQPVQVFGGEQPYISKDGADLRDYVHGEGGRWSRWGMPQWQSEFDRFGRIFFEPDQLYPQGGRKFLPASEVGFDPVSVDNGATDVTREEFALSGGKQRRLLTSLPGNHDLGFGKDIQRTVRDRFRTHFGDSNRINVLGNHTFVSVDTPSLSAYSQYWDGDETSPQLRDRSTFLWTPPDEFLTGLKRTTRNAVMDALNEYYPQEYPNTPFRHEVTDPIALGVMASDFHIKASEQDPHLPVIVLTHVPLFRTPGTDCGRLRERQGSIPFTGGYQYQNVLTPTATNQIITSISSAKIGEIAHVFSGDDHDYCDVMHLYNVESWNRKEKKSKLEMMNVREITVKSFSWAMGIRRPGFMLVSLWNPVDGAGNTIGTPLPTVQSHLCLLPDQLGVFVHYVLLFCFTLVVLFVYSVVKALRTKGTNNEDDGPEDRSNLFTPSQFQKKFNIDPDRSANTESAPNGEIHNRERSSTSTSIANNQSTHLSVQRTYNARTRSASPSTLGAGTPPPRSATPRSFMEGLQQKGGPLIDQAGYYPQLRWNDPDDSDEESHVGESQWDSQAKWKKATRPRSRVRIALDEFTISVALVGVPSGLLYAVLIKNG